MAKQSIDTLKGWFETNDYPTQQQFWDWLDSFFHLDASLEISNIDGLTDALTAKANTDQLAALNNKVVLAPGTASWAVPAGTIVETFWVVEPTNITLTVGKTLGGNDIINGEQFTGELIYDKKVSFYAAGTLYFGGITGNTIIIILKR